MSLLSWLLVTLAGLSLAGMVVSMIVARRAAREARSTIFPIVREEETTRARRARIMSSLTGVIATILAGAFFLSGQLPLSTIRSMHIPDDLLARVLPSAPKTQAQPAPPETVALPASTQPSTPNAQPPAPPATDPQEAFPGPRSGTPGRGGSETAEGPQPQDSATSPAIAQPPTGTPTSLPPTLTSTSPPPPTATPPPPLPTSTRPPATAPVGTQLGPIAFTAQIVDRRAPITPTEVFSDTVDRVYATFAYDGMQNGVDWSHVWYYNGVEFSRNEESWRYGSSARSFVFITPVGAGDYRLELYVNDDLLASGEFMIEGPAAIGGPTTSTAIPASPGSTETPGSP